MFRQNQSADGIVVVVAAKELALLEYERYIVYLCPAPYLKNKNGQLYATGYGKKLFWDCSHCAFYGENQIYPTVPRILARVQEVKLTHEGVELVTDEFVGDQDVDDIKARLTELVKSIEDDQQPPENRQKDLHQVFFLSRPDDPETEQLSAPVINNKQDKNRNGTAFTQKFRYVTLDSLKRATHTSALEIV